MSLRKGLSIILNGLLTMIDPATTDVTNIPAPENIHNIQFYILFLRSFLYYGSPR